MILLRQKLGHAPLFSCTVAAWVPFNIIIIPILPVLFIFNKFSIVNTIFLHIIYLPCALLGIAAFLLAEAIFYPFALIMALAYKTKALLYC